MKEVVRSNSDVSETAAAPPLMVQTSIVTRPPGTGSSHQRSMYQAALKGDWEAAKALLDRDPSLLCDELTERGDRGLHVAVAMKHQGFVRELVNRMSPIQLEILKDGHGYTACCHAAATGVVEIAEILIRKHPNLGTARDGSYMTPLQKAVSRGNAKMASYFLEAAGEKDLLDEEWFDLLLESIRRGMFGEALKILEKNGRIATMANEEGTALHLLARQSGILITTKWEALEMLQENGSTATILAKYEGTTSHRLRTVWQILFISKWDLVGQMKPYARSLAKMLWGELRKLGEDNVVEMMKCPSILHSAAKAGNVELITMLTRVYPDLIWHTDSDGYTIFHVAVIHKQECVFSLIHQIGGMKDFIATAKDKDGNNILHLAGKLSRRSIRKIVPFVGLQMQREIIWFNKVEMMVPPSCLETRNDDGRTPREVFSKEHEALREESAAWMRNIADSCLLVSTIFLTVAFAVAFAVPGGYDSKTGIPVLVKEFWFSCFVVFEGAAVCGSILSIVHFWAIMMSSFDEDLFLVSLPSRLRAGLNGMLWSLLGTITVYLCACFLAFYQGKMKIVLYVGLLLYVLIFREIFRCINNLYVTVRLPNVLWRLPARPRSGRVRAKEKDSILKLF